MKKIFSCFGITIIKQEEKYFMQYDNGEMASAIKQIEISGKKLKKYKSKKMEMLFMSV